MVESYLNCSICPSHTVPTRAMPALLSHSVLMLGPRSTHSGHLDLPRSVFELDLACLLYTEHSGQLWSTDSTLYPGAPFVISAVLSYGCPRTILSSPLARH